MEKTGGLSCSHHYISRALHHISLTKTFPYSSHWMPLQRCYNEALSVCLVISLSFSSHCTIILSLYLSRVNEFMSWFSNFAIGIPHHNIMDKREELCIQEDLTVREGRYITEDTSSGCTLSFFSPLLLTARERSECASKPCTFIK